MDELKCPHCGKKYDKYSNIIKTADECLDDRVVIVTTDYRCPHCGGFVRGTQQGEIVYWQPETFERV